MKKLRVLAVLIMYSGACFVWADVGSRLEEGENLPSELTQTPINDTLTPSHGSCGGEYSSMTGMIRHPPLNSSAYHNRELCTWIINPGGAGLINITFTKFNTQTHRDYLYLRDGTDMDGAILLRWSGTRLPYSILTTTNAANVHFTSDDNGNRTGFELQWEPFVEIEDPCDSTAQDNYGRYLGAYCGYDGVCVRGYWQCNNGRCIPNSGLCDGIDSCGDNSDESSAPVITKLHGPSMSWGEGTEVKLTCELRCNSVEPQWYHNESIINFNSSGQVSVNNTERDEQYISVLTLRSVNLSDSGNYTCEPSNAESSHIMLHITTGCPGGFFMSTGSAECFKFFPEKRGTWFEANATCEAEGLIMALPTHHSLLALREDLLHTYGVVGGDDGSYVWLSGVGTYSTLCEVPLVFNSTELIVNPNEKIQLDCGIINGNHSDCVWEKDNDIFQVEKVYNGLYIGIGRPENTESNQCGIVIEKASIEHHGIWTCVIHNNRYGNFVGSKNVVVRVAPITAEVFPNQVTANIGDLYELQCRIIGTRPAAKITWILNGRYITSATQTLKRHSNHKDTFETLSVLNHIFKGEDNGQKLMCIVDHYTLADPENTSVSITVVFAPIQKQDQTFYQISLNTDYEVKCVFSANPGPTTLQWSYEHNLQNISHLIQIPSDKGKFSTSAINLKNGNYQALLRIAGVTEDDLMTKFTLHAENEYGEANYKFMFSKDQGFASYGPLLFDRNHKVANLNQKVELDCGITSNYYYCIWEKDNDIIQVDDVYKGLYSGISSPENSEGNQCGLVINRATFEDQGMWICKIYTQGTVLQGSKNLFLTVYCEHECEPEDEWVCATNGESYRNQCWLSIAACQAPEESILTKHKGKCHDNVISSNSDDVILQDQTTTTLAPTTTTVTSQSPTTNDEANNEIAEPERMMTDQKTLSVGAIAAMVIVLLVVVVIAGAGYARYKQMFCFVVRP